MSITQTKVQYLALNEFFDKLDDSSKFRKPFWEHILSIYPNAEEEGYSASSYFENNLSLDELNELCSKLGLAYHIVPYDIVDIQEPSGAFIQAEAELNEFLSGIQQRMLQATEERNYKGVEALLTELKQNESVYRNKVRSHSKVYVKLNS